MTESEIQTKYNRLIDLLRKMRGAQKEYFKYRARTDLDAAKKYEREVDHIIIEEVKNLKSNQTEMF